MTRLSLGARGALAMILLVLEWLVAALWLLFRGGTVAAAIFLGIGVFGPPAIGAVVRAGPRWSAVFGVLGVAAVQAIILAAAVGRIAIELGDADRGLNAVALMSLLLVAAAALTVAATLLQAIRTWASWRVDGALARVAATMLGAAAASLALAVAAAVARPTRADCLPFAPSAAKWASGSHERIAAALVHCRTLIGADEDGVRATIGPPEQEWPGAWSYTLAGRVDMLGDLRTDTLTISFAHGRVSDVTLVRDATGD